MSRFKKGDKVRVIQFATPDIGNNRYFSIGDIGIVMESNVHARGLILTDVSFKGQGNKNVIDGGRWWVYCEDSLALVYDFKFDISTLDEDALIPEELYKKGEN